MTSLARRTACSRARRCRVGRVLLAMLAATGCADRPAPSCRASAPVEVDLEAWQAAVDAGVGPERDRLLASLEMEPLPGGPEGGGETQVQLTPVRRGEEEADDLLVAVRWRGPDGSESLRSQLLRPLSGHDGLFCPLGDDLSRDKEAYEEPCLEPHHGPARELSTEPLLAPYRDAVVVRDAGGWCGPGIGRVDRFATSWWGVEDGRLVRYLEVVTHEARYESPAPPGEVRRAEIALSAGWPRAITVTETVECPPTEGTGGDTGCRPVERSTRYQYTDGRYAAVSDRAPRADPARGEEETEP